MPRVGLVDVDRTDWRNRNLMLASSYYKSQGYEVVFPYDPRVHGRVDKVHASSVFIRNRYKIFKLLDALGIAYTESEPLFVDMELPDWIEIGGTAWNIHKDAPAHIEACRPDYSLYDAVLGPANYVQGFLTRGCPRGCHFCVVPEMSGDKATQRSTFAELLAGNPNAKYIRLMDDNFLAGPKDFVREQLRWIIEKNPQGKKRGGLKFSLTQGADIRFMNEEWAHLLAESPFCGVDGQHRQITFAFDSPKILKQYMRGFGYLMQAGIKPHQIASFVLTGFESTVDEDMLRVETLRELGAYPYVMVYEPIHGEGIPQFYIDNPHILREWHDRLVIDYNDDPANRHDRWIPQDLTVEELYFRHWKRCKHLQRYTNMRAIWKTVRNFEDYDYWIKQKKRWCEEDRRGVRRVELPQAKHLNRWGGDVE